MDIQFPKIPSSQVPPHHIILIQPPQQKTQLHQHHSNKTPIVIDYGSQTIKAGYLNYPSPNMVFRPQVSKTRDPSKTELPVKYVMNLSYDQLDFAKNNFKSPYEKNIVLHFSVLQQCHDYIFSELLKPGKKIQSSLIISQPFANPIHCRSAILSQLFSCYEVNEIIVGIDALFAYFYELGCSMEKYKKQNALLVHMGANVIHTCAFVNGKVQFGSVRRINVGGSNAFELFSRSLLLKNVQLKTRLHYRFLRDLYQNYTQVAYDYREQIRYFQTQITMKPNIHVPINPQIYHNKIHQQNTHEPQTQNRFIEMIEIDFQVILEVPEEEIRRKEQMKIRMAEKLRETIERRKQLKKKMHQFQLKQLVDLRDRYQSGDKEAHEEVVEMFGPHKFFDKLTKKIQTLSAKLGLQEEKPEQNKFSLIDIPDHELTSEKLKLKRIQIYQKNMLEAKRRKLEQKFEQQQKMKDLRENNPHIYLQQLKQKYKLLSQKIKENQRLKKQLNNRKSRLKQKRMQVLARLAEQEYDENKQENDQDIQTFKDPEDSDHYSQLEVMEAELREIDPQWNNIRKDIHHLNSSNQLIMNTDLIKCHEIYFEPRLIGCQQSGLITSIRSSIQILPIEIQSKLLSNIWLIGGGSTIPGLKSRIQKDLKQECPTGIQINVNVGKGGHLGAYHGMQEVMKLNKKELNQYFYQKVNFGKSSGMEFVENPWSNPKPRPI